MPTEYHNRILDGRRLSWRVDRLRAAAAALPARPLPLADIFEFDEVYWFDADYRPTCRAVVEHALRIQAADIADPILLAPDGRVIDGMHRVARAFMLGRTHIAAMRLPAYPPPDRTAPEA